MTSMTLVWLKPGVKELRLATRKNMSKIINTYVWNDSLLTTAIDLLVVTQIVK